MLVLSLLLGYDARPVGADVKVHGEGSGGASGAGASATSTRVIGTQIILRRTVVTGNKKTDSYWIKGRIRSG